jgi:xylonate dehydratase
MSESASDLLLDSGEPGLYDITSTVDPREGRLPLDEHQLAGMASGDLFGWAQDVAMGLDPVRLGRRELLILSTLGGRRGDRGESIALGFHSGHWELGMLVDAASTELAALGATPFAAYVSDPCDGRSNGTPAMLDSLPYRNDAAIVMRRLARSLPTASGVMGIATCDKGLPAMMMALAGNRDVPSVIVPGGVMLLTRGAEDTAVVQTLSTRFARGEISLDYAAIQGCVACGSAGGGCQFMGTAATSQVVAEGLGWSLPHSALHPSGTNLWMDMARRSARALHRITGARSVWDRVLSDSAISNAMALHAAVGGSTNLYLHLPAIAHAAGLRRPTIEQWLDVNRRVPRLVDALPNGPRNFATVQVFMAGGVPEVMLRLAESGALDLEAATISGRTVGENLEWWEHSDRRRSLRSRLEREGVDPDDVIRPTSRPLPGTVSIVTGNLAPGGALVKSTAIASTLVGPDGVYRASGKARVFSEEGTAIAAIKAGAVQAGEILVLIGVGPSFGMPETYQITSALKHIDLSGQIPLITDGRFSGVSTGPCVGHVTPEAAVGGPLGRVRDGDVIDVIIDTRTLDGSIDVRLDPSSLLARPTHPGLENLEDRMPDDTRLWAALQARSGGAWAGCVYDTDLIIEALGDPAT